MPRLMTQTQMSSVIAAMTGVSSSRPRWRARRRRRASRKRRARCSRGRARIGSLSSRFRTSASTSRTPRLSSPSTRFRARSSRSSTFTAISPTRFPTRSSRQLVKSMDPLNLQGGQLHRRQRRAAGAQRGGDPRAAGSRTGWCSSRSIEFGNARWLRLRRARSEAARGRRQGRRVRHRRDWQAIRPSRTARATAPG